MSDDQLRDYKDEPMTEWYMLGSGLARMERDLRWLTDKVVRY